MEDLSYWQRQIDDQPLFPDIVWSKPEQKSQSGKLGLVGGNSSSFISVAENCEVALKTGVGEVNILLPDSLKKNLPKTIINVTYAPSNPSGSLAKQAIDQLNSLGQWANLILLIGDTGQNSETAILYEKFISQYQGPLVITRDAIDLLKNSSQTLIERPKTLIVASFAQLQKIFQAVYYPKILTFSMNLTNLVEAIHKFTITYPTTILTFHDNNVLIAHDGRVTTTSWQNPLAIWRGQIATKAAVYWLWNQGKPLESITASLSD